jgi:hypothetical protein
MRSSYRFGSLALALACLLHAGAVRAEEQPKPRTVHFKGKVVEPKGKAGTIALSCDDGKVYPLVEDDGSRMLFAEKSLRGRDVRLAGELVNGDRLRVAGVQTYTKGKLHDAYYWCANCQLAYSGPGECLCCGDVVKLVEVEFDPKGKKPLLLKPR